MPMQILARRRARPVARSVHARRSGRAMVAAYAAVVRVGEPVGAHDSGGTWAELKRSGTPARRDGQAHAVDAPARRRARDAAAAAVRRIARRVDASGAHRSRTDDARRSACDGARAVDAAAPAPHVEPHAPQLLGLESTSTHAPPHDTVGGMQVPPPVHAPMTQLAPLGHRWPHMPQLFASDARLAHVVLMPMPGQGTVGATHAPPFAGAHVPLPSGLATHTSEQHAEELWHAAPIGAHAGSPPKSTPTRARPFGCIDNVTCATTPAPTVAVTGLLTHVGTMPGAGGHCIGNALALKSTRPVGMPLKLRTELVPGLTLKSSWTVRVAAATTPRHPTSAGYSALLPCALRRFRRVGSRHSSNRGRSTREPRAR